MAEVATARGNAADLSWEKGTKPSPGRSRAWAPSSPKRIKSRARRPLTTMVVMLVIMDRLERNLFTVLSVGARP